MLKAQQEIIDLNDLFSPLLKEKKVGIAVSGGIDSLALMLMIKQWTRGQKTNPEIYVYCVDHGLRDGSNKEVEFVIEQANKLKFKVRGLKWEGEKPVSGLQEKARKARYKIIARAMKQDGVEILLTAHHVFDQAETILMRLSHASGISGLCGMASIANIEGAEGLRVFRPLLETSKNTLKNIVDKAGLVPIIDPSNSDEKYERVRWRKILPILAELGLDSGRFAIFSKRLRRADEALNSIGEEVFQKISNIDDFGILRIDYLLFLQQSEEIQFRLIQKSLRYIGAKKKPYALAQIENLIKTLTQKCNFAKQTLHGCSICIKDKHIEIMREHEKIPDSEIILKVGEEIIWDNRFVIKNTSKANIIISSALVLTKKEITDFQISNKNKMLHIRSAPLIRNIAGDIVAIGAFVIGKNSVKISHNINLKS